MADGLVKGAAPRKTGGAKLSKAERDKLRVPQAPIADLPAKFRPGKFDLRVKKSRSGLGLFAGEMIPKDSCIIEYTGKVMTEEEYQASNSVYIFDIGKPGALDGSPRWNTARYINHSCVPNCYPDVRKRRVFIFAKRDIQPGEELAYNYGEEYFNHHLADICSCPKCTKKREKAGKV